MASASATQTAGGATPRVLPVFFKNSDMIVSDGSAELSVFEVCYAAEKISGHSSIEGAQKIRNLWRIYPISQEARQNLLVSGIALRSQHIDLMDANPYIHGNDRQTTKVIISDIPLSVANHDIKPLFMKKGYKPVSDIKYECARDTEGKLTRFKTGRRFLFMEVPQTPLPNMLEIAGFRARVYHKEQKVSQEKAANRESYKCRKCLKTGHFTRECREGEFTCFDCTQPGHKRGRPPVHSFQG